MKTDVDSYEFVTRNEDELELYNFEDSPSNSEVIYIVCSDCVTAEGKTLNTEYHASDDLRKFSPEIFVESRVDGSDESVKNGTVRLEVIDERGVVVGQRETPISNLGHSVKPGYGFVPYVNIDAGVKPQDLAEIRVFIVCD